jgi:hypothetical protein
MSLGISFVGVTRERPCEGFRASATFTFRIFKGSVKTLAEVILADGGLEIIEQRGKDAKAAARIALDRTLANGRDPFKTLVFLRIPYRHAAFFSKYGPH